jgi:hypothetical protein
MPFHIILREFVTRVISARSIIYYVLFTPFSPASLYLLTRAPICLHRQCSHNVGHLKQQIFLRSNKINVYAASFISRESFCLAIFQMGATWEKTTCKTWVRRSWVIFRISARCGRVGEGGVGVRER